MPTDRNKVEQYSKAYERLKFYQDFMFRLYFKTEVVGLDKLPENATLIFAPNHQNALIDALAILTIKRKWQPVFLARADIFKKPLLSKILTFLKIMPVYRIRDGYENLSLNNSIFKKTMDVLRNKNGLVILPEGNHAGFKRLRQLKKGIARIAFQAEEASSESLNIHIVPVGLEYSNYVKYHSKLLIRIGDPFPISKYLSLYRENKAQAYNTLIDELRDRLKEEIINIDSEEYYNGYLSVMDIFTDRFIKEQKIKPTQNHKFIINKKLVTLLDETKAKNEKKYESFMSSVNRYAELLEKFHIPSGGIPLKAKKIFLLPLQLLLILLFSPLALYGFVNHAISILGAYFLSNKFEDVQFHSSVRHGIILILLPLSYLIQFLVVGFIFGFIWYAFLYLVTLPLSAIILYNWRETCFRVADTVNVVWLTLVQNKSIKEVNALNSEIYSWLKQRISIKNAARSKS